MSESAFEKKSGGSSKTNPPAPKSTDHLVDARTGTVSVRDNYYFVRNGHGYVGKPPKD